MKIRKSKSLLAVGVILITCVIVILSGNSIQGGERRYEIKPKITIPAQRTDTARVIDAYERMMDRFMDLTERNLTVINTDIRSITKKLVSIDRKLTELSTRMARIEKALGIEQSKKPVVEPKTQTHSHTDKPCSKSLE